jgi:ubiquinone/menaquinone biosynthesis C-methylase UbiE
MNSGFDLLAPVYRWMEMVFAGDKLQRCRSAFLEELPVPARILIVGEGHGRSVVECARRFPNAQITCVEASSAMIAQARQQLARSGFADRLVTFIHADVLNWEPPAAAFDLIITHFFLDCFTLDELERIVPLIASLAGPNAHWIIADFQIAPSGWQRWRSIIIVGLLYVFFRATTGLSARQLTLPDAWLRNSGFTLLRRLETEWGLLKSEWWQRMP